MTTSTFKTKLAIIASVFLLPGLTAAQVSGLAARDEAVGWHSGIHDGRGKTTRLAASHVVISPGGTWLRLFFDRRMNLGSGSYLTLTSLEDGAIQVLDASNLGHWHNTSAYLNGDAVEVALFVEPTDRNVFVEIEKIVVGEEDGRIGTRTICGVDNRVASSDDAVGRITTVGCTGWLLNDGRAVTAGHCVSSGLQILQFNVPLSAANGALRHPGPEDQYPIIQSSVTTGNGDWAIFSLANNSQTGLSALQAQGKSFTVVQNLNAPTIRITGHGTDGGTANQTQQTHSGPNSGSSGATMRYAVDTTGGNSGSPIIDTATGFSLGVHTNGGCTANGGSNFGTATTNASFWNALNSGNNAPEAPTNLTASAAGNAITLNWSDNSTGEDLFEIQRSSGGGFSAVGSVGTGVRTFTDSGLPNGTFTYRVRASRDGLFSDFSNTATETIGTGGGILDADFNVGNDGFVFDDDDSGPAYTDGNRNANGGVGGSGALQISAGGVDAADITNMEADWVETFTASGARTLSLQGRLVLTPDYESDEFGEIAVRVDGALTILARLTGDGNGGANMDTGFVTYTLNLNLNPGSHELRLNCFNNQKTFANEETTCIFDNVRID